MQGWNKAINIFTYRLLSQLGSRRWNHFISNWRALGDQSARNNVFIFPLFSLHLPSPLRFNWLLNRSNRLGEISLSLMWLWRVTSTEARTFKRSPASSLQRSALTTRGSFSAPDWSLTKAVNSPRSENPQKTAALHPEPLATKTKCGFDNTLFITQG